MLFLPPLSINMRIVLLLLPFLLFIAVSCNEPAKRSGGNADDTNNPAPPMFPFTVLVKIYPHDTTSFTEGSSEFNTLYEGTGNRGSSRLIQSDIETGKTVKDVKLVKDFFGEGITILNNKIYELTWQEHKGFVYGLNTLQNARNGMVEGGADQQWQERCSAQVDQSLWQVVQII